MNKQKWTSKDTETAIDWQIKMDQSVINFAKNKLIELTTASKADATNLELQKAISAQESRIIHLEAKLARFVASIPELLGA